MRLWDVFFCKCRQSQEILTAFGNCDVILGSKKNFCGAYIAGLWFVGTSQTVSNKHVLIMDEVDGMAGNEDRGGIQVNQ